jgi:hypothetical protein
MALVKRPTPFTGIKIEETAPKGTFLAVCLKAIDEHQVERRKYQSQETELQNVTRFYFGLIKDKKPYVVRSREFKINFSPKAGLLAFLNAWNGDNFPDGVDYCEWAVGKGAQITVIHKDWDGKTYANISGIAPVMEGLEVQVPKLKAFAKFLEAAPDVTSETPATHDTAEADKDGDPF